MQVGKCVAGVSGQGWTGGLMANRSTENVTMAEEEYLCALALSKGMAFERIQEERNSRERLPCYLVSSERGGMGEKGLGKCEWNL